VERTLTINAISTLLLALGVLPKLKETAEKEGVDTRLTFVGSSIHILAPINELTSIPEGVDTFDALSDPKKADMNNRYPLSKLIEHMLFNELVTRLHANAPPAGENKQVIVNILNPGWCESELIRNKPPEGYMIKFMAVIFRRSQEAGSRTLVHAVTAGRETDGKYLSECEVLEQSTFVRSAEGRKVQEKVWNDFVRRVEKAGDEDAVSVVREL
jgi:retinol dehydrogenase 12